MSAFCDFIGDNNGYQCLVRSLTITQPEQEIFEFRANPMSVKKLTIIDQQVHYFPKNLWMLLPNLEHIEIVNCGMKEIYSRDLEGLGQLKYLNLSNNSLRYLPDDLFHHVPQLLEANFKGNYIRMRLLEPLMSHQRVDLTEQKGSRVLNVTL